MELIVLGCYSPYPVPGQACSGYLLKNEKTNILIDCGHSVFSTLYAYVDHIDLDAVIISHFHPDHFADLYALRHALRGARFLGEKTDVVPLYIPNQPSADFNYWLKTEEFAVIKIKEGLESRIGDIQMKFRKVKHTIPAFGVEIFAPNSRFFYTADTAFDAELAAKLAPLDLLLAESTFLAEGKNDAASMGHMCTIDTGNWARIAQAKKLVATHFWPNYPLAQLQKEIATAFEGKVYMADTGLKISF